MKQKYFLEEDRKRGGKNVIGGIFLYQKRLRNHSFRCIGFVKAQTAAVFVVFRDDVAKLSKNENG